MRNLSVAEIQLVEIAKAVSFESDILIMDEPTSAISEREVDKLFEILRALRKRGTSIIYISHKMDEIFQISDRITVMRDGEHICTKLSSELNNETLIKYMVGRELTEQFPKKTAAIKDAIMEVEHFSDGHYFEDINFKVRRGEVLGIAGLMGAGRTELVEAIFGMRKTNSGNLKICGEEVKIRSPREAIMNKIALVPEDRKIVGLNLLFSIMGNITLPTLSKFCACGIISKRKEREIADDYIKLLRIATPTRNKPVVELSGGNQQKVVIAKWLLTNADIVIMDEPTRGIDVGAKAEIYEIINKLVAEGKAVIMISSEMPEVIGMSDRILVMSEGKITGELTRNEFSQEKIMGLASIV
jgi:ABC-type sugar transport system ATPase subunit